MYKRRLLYNTGSALFNELVTLICDFLIPRQILLFYGSDVNGLLASITQFLGFITLTEMGIEAVVKSALYKPLAVYDETEISRIMKSARLFFVKIGRILLAYIVILCIVYPVISNSIYNNAYIIPLILAISISIVAQYYFGITNQILLIADQRAYIPLLLNSFSMLFNTCISIVLIHIGQKIQVVKLVASLALLIKPVGMTVYVRNNYRIIRNINLPYEPIKQKWNGFAQHLASFCLSHTDVVVLTLFSTLKNVSIYNIYYMVVAGIRRLLTTAMSGVDALFGNMYAKQDPKLTQYFALYEWIMHTGVTLLFSIAAMLICPFISVYTKGVNDANYVDYLLGALLVAAYGAYCIRLPYNTMVLAAGHYKETQTSAIIEAMLNIIVSIATVRRYGIYGVAIGTLVAMMYRSCYLALYLRNAIIFRPFYFFMKHIIVDAIVILLVVFSCRWILYDVKTYWEWFKLALQVFSIATIEVVFINLVVYMKDLKNAAILLKQGGWRNPMSR